MATIDVPIGIKILNLSTRNCHWHFNKDFWYRTLVLVLTFISYMSYHLTRKPLSVVKNVLHTNSSNNTGWAPFNNDDGENLFSALDSAFLFTYAFAMFVSGIVADRVNLRWFLAMGMLFSGIFCYFFGLAKSLNIHSLWYFIVMQILMGIFQTTGWPAVVSIVGHWFGKGKRGLVFGIWNSHTSIGNILGTLIAGYYVETNWGYSFIVPGLLMVSFGFLIFSFLVVYPEDVGCTSPEATVRVTSVPSYSAVPQNEVSSDDEENFDDDREDVPYRRNKSSPTETSPILVSTPQKAIGFIDALKIPGVFEFSLSLFFSKLVSYTFLFWLPYYIKSSTKFKPGASARLSTLFDVGGIFGAIIAGLVTDATNMPASVCIVMLFLAVPSLFLYETFGKGHLTINIILLLISGAFVNGPYALITTAISAELGTHECLQGNSKAVATVTAIIDGTGSIGAAVGPLIAGLVSHKTGWDVVFYFLMASDLAALLLLLRLTFKEVTKFRNTRHRHRYFS